MEKMYLVVLWYQEFVVNAINITAKSRREAIESAKLQYPNYKAEITTESEAE